MSIDESEDSTLSSLESKGWVEKVDNHFYTTANYPRIGADKFVIPPQDCLKSLQKVHSDYGHATVKGMSRILKIWNLWIVGFQKIAREVYRGCNFCNECRESYFTQRVALPMPKHAFELVMADFACPEKEKYPGFLVLRDRYSGWTEIRAIEKLDSLEVRQLLLEWGARFGFPSIFLTDNAEAFNAGIMQSLYEKFNILHRKTPIYEPQSNGAVERSIKSIEEGLRIELLSGSPIQEAVHTVAGRLNRTSTSPGEISKTPYEVVFKFCEINPLFRQAKSPRQFTHDLEIGQTVLTKIPNAGKLSPQFEDKNLHISNIVGDNVYQLSDIFDNEIKVLYRRDRLKPIFKSESGNNTLNFMSDLSPTKSGGKL
jgi:hypothetical protein